MNVVVNAYYSTVYERSRMVMDASEPEITENLRFPAQWVFLRHTIARVAPG